MEGGQLVFLVGRVDAVVVEAEADKQRFHAEIGLEITDDGNGAAAARGYRRLRPFIRQRVLGLGQERRVIGELDRRRTAMGMELDRTVPRNPLPDEFLERRADLLGILLVDKAEGDFRRRLPVDRIRRGPTPSLLLSSAFQLAILLSESPCEREL